jgi:hypothetical protein
VSKIHEAETKVTRLWVNTQLAKDLWMKQTCYHSFLRGRLSSGKWRAAAAKWVNTCTVLPNRCDSHCPPRERNLAGWCLERPATMPGRRRGILTQLSHWLTLRASVFPSRRWQGRMSSALEPPSPTCHPLIKAFALPCLIIASENHILAAGKDSRARNIPFHR